MEGSDNEIPSNYTAPQLLSGVAEFLSFTRFSGSTNFADLVSPDMNEQKNYTYGMIFLVTIMATILALWASILIVLKYHGDATGCAAGKPFQTSVTESTVRTSVSHPSTQNETFDSSSLESRAHDVENNNAAQRSTEEAPKGPSKDPVRVAKRRQKRTRIVFAVFGVTILACTILLLMFSFSSFQRTIESSDDIVMASQDIVDQIKSTVRTVESAVEYANDTFSQTTLDLRTACPNYVNANVTGINLNQLTDLMRDEFETLRTVGTVNMTEINRTLETVQNGLDRMGDAIGTTSEKMWVFPLVLLIVFITGTAMLAGLILAWTGKSSSSFERNMAYGVLPILIIVAIVCWLLALGAAIASLVTADACVSPEATVQAILEEHNVDMNSTSSKLITFYTNGCEGEDPTDVFTEFEESLQTAVGSIWHTISVADSIGREELSSKCGNDVDPLLDGARNLARSLTWTRKALISSIGSLQCGPIHEIYVEAIHQSFCQEGGEGLAWAFILFSVVGIGAMVMVSLRSSLYNHVGEEEVYDENDEVDNMILNEHEEYLAYISKYKHEWEEYRGMNATEPFEQTQSLGSTESVQSIVASESWTERGDDDTGIEGDSWDADTDGYDLTASSSEYGSIESCPTEDISFPSLAGSDKSNSPEQGGSRSPAVFVPPSILGPRRGGSDEGWDQEPDFFLGDKNTQLTVQPAATDESEEPNVEMQLSPPKFANTTDKVKKDTSKSSTVDKTPTIGTLPMKEVFHKSISHVQSPVSEYSAGGGGGEPDWYVSTTQVKWATQVKCAAGASDSIDVGVPMPSRYSTPPLEEYTPPEEDEYGPFNITKHFAAIMQKYEI